MTKTTIALAAVLFAATNSAALAQGFDPDLANRYPGDAQPGVYGYSDSGKLGSLQSTPVSTFQFAPVRLQQRGNAYLQSAPVFQQRDVSLPTDTRFDSGPFWYRGSGPTTGGM
jgi:hypothetical protein